MYLKTLRARIQLKRISFVAVKRASFVSVFEIKVNYGPEDGSKIKTSGKNYNWLSCRYTCIVYKYTYGSN